MRQAPALLLAVVCTALPIGTQLAADRHAGWMMVDFRAYYCASLAQRQHGNPYFVQPLHGCEQETPAPYYRAPATVTVPAPYPPYALALLSPLTLLPFGAAAIVWWMLLAAAIGVAAYAVTRITQEPPLVGWAIFGVSLGLTCFSAGNAMALAVSVIVVAALCAHRGRPVAAAIAVAFAAFEPQIALPAAVGLFAGYRAIRVPLLLAFAVLGALSLIAGGVAQNVSYVTSVLPAHALSEVSRDNQYSLSTVVSALGVPDRASVLAGSISYLLMMALGVVVALRLARRFEERALIALVPCAFALLGGTFVHTEAIAAAAPAALVLFTRAQEHRGWLFAALVLLAVPWMYATSVTLFLAPLFPIAYLTYALWRRERVAVLATAVAAAAGIFGLFLMAATPGHPAGSVHAYPPIDPRLAEASWRQFVLGGSTNRLATWLLRLPTWTGLAGLAFGAAALAGAFPSPRAYECESTMALGRTAQ